MWLLIALMLIIACAKLFGKLLPYLILALIILYLIKLWWLIAIIILVAILINKKRP
ncbi:hypothetical protein Q757_00195 [Oenococcus alcoholitolerans]|uniref:Uncharacterized protein n=1 Tax=Oenococcus alcoholitolerans TaxID=931074 RepID=A0ABR4XSX5_9LACO|nr:hypothetical protein Q757_00195 [Oenococcus alcoholitolerans]